MADPISMGLMAAGSLVKGVAGMRAGQQQKMAYHQDAVEQAVAGNQQALLVRDRARQMIGDQVAAQFGNGFQGGTGTALQALGESQINMTLDMMNAQREGMARAASDEAQGQMAEQKGNMALLSGVLDAGTSVYKGYKDWAAAKAGQTAPAPKPAPSSSISMGPAYARWQAGG